MVAPFYRLPDTPRNSFALERLGRRLCAFLSVSCVREARDLL